MARRGYPPEFRRRLEELVEGGRKVAEVAAELGISQQTVFCEAAPRVKRFVVDPEPFLLSA